MSRAKRTDLRIEAEREAMRLLGAFGTSLRAARQRRRLTQRRLAQATGLSRQAVSGLELASIPSAQLRDLVALAITLGIPLRLELGRDPQASAVDAGHLAIQELLLRLGRRTGYTGSFELPIRPGESRHSVDVLLMDPVRGRLILVEAWNTIGDIGGSARSFDRKLAAARELAVGRGHDEMDVHGVWVVRATARNRALLAGYPEVFLAKFPGSSRAWVTALAGGTSPPREPGLVWCDVAASRLFEWRRRDRRGATPAPAR